MRVKSIVDEDFTNYKKASMFIGTISCNGKCCLEAGIPLTVCQNDNWRCEPVISILDTHLCERYLANPITKAIVFGGLEPLEQSYGVLDFISMIRTDYGCDDDIVIYTGYTEDECRPFTEAASVYPNIIMKFGRYIPDQPPHYDDVLGVWLVSDNQYGKRIS